MQNDIVAQGLELMLYGMGTVVVFLAVLVVATLLMSWVVGRFFPELESAEVSTVGSARTSGSTAQDADLVAVITAAIHRYRQDHK
ncbi:MAG: OadG family protein [Halieaceae bacterium]|jgi:oxaloacetate decarboxylase (Na+ extruding) subunit gamma|nr:OadG family protein [Halieaceae bacterium]